MGARPSVPRKLPHEAQDLLDRNAFVVLGNVECQNLKDGYFACHPNFITADAVLYVFHGLFRGGLSAYEKRELAPLAASLCEAALGTARERHSQLRDDPLLGEAARRNLVFLAVAQALASGQAPRDEQDEAAPLVARIRAADQPGFYPDEDFTVYRPRGVYAEDEQLARYFQTMTWLSRVILPIVPGNADTEPDASIKLRQAYLLGQMLQDEQLRRKWQRLYDEIGFFIAKPDSFSPVQFLEAIGRVPGPTDDKWVGAVRAEFAKPAYPASKIVPVPQRSPGDAPRKYVQFMGARYIPDGQIHQESCFPHVSGRTVPKGLDIGYALFDSRRAKVHLADDFAEYADLGPALARLHGTFSTYASAPEPESIYAGWIGAIREIVEAPTSPNVPAFFGSPPWRDKSLTTALASWTQLRHDFVLYAKEPVSPASGGLDFLVEPVPAAYERLERLAGMLRKRDFPGMEGFEALCRVLKIVAECERAGEDWRESKAYKREESRRAGDSWDFYLPAFGQWLLRGFSAHVAVEQPCIVVDVCTDSNAPNRVLHEATGPLNLVVARRGGLEYWGWVLSYYEFTEPDFTRFTDREWSQRVEGGRHRALRPSWVGSYMHGGP